MQGGAGQGGPRGDFRVAGWLADGAEKAQVDEMARIATYLARLQAAARRGS
jgi:hypothetical protein